MDEDQTVSVSKGVFVFKNGFKASKRKGKTKKKHVSNILSCNEAWDRSYCKLWSSLEEEIECLNNEMFSTVLANLVDYVSLAYKGKEDEIPTAALLTGINMPDHRAQFSALTKQIKQKITPHVACLYGQDCQNLKYFMENMINQFVNEDRDEGDDDDMEVDGQRAVIKKTMLSMSLLQSWYEDLDCKRNLVVIIPDFESFNPTVIQDFIQIASSYINVLPFVIIFGIATSISTLHTSLPYHVTSRISVKVFHSKKSTDYLNKILEEIFFTLDCPFQLGGKVFNLFMDIFLFYDLSVSGFIKNIKYAMLEHFSYGNAMSLCIDSKKEIRQLIREFTHEDCENARRLLSFRKLVENESNENKIMLLTDDDYFKTVLEEEVYKLKKYVRRLHIFLKALHTMVSDLPKAPLGRHIRELYSIATTKNITKTQEYKECFQLLNFQSKDELCRKIVSVIQNVGGLLNTTCNKPTNKLQEFVVTLTKFIEDIKLIENDDAEEILTDVTNMDDQITSQLNRMQLKEKLKIMSRKSIKPMNKYEIKRQQLLDYISETFEFYLVEPSSLNFHEICFFNDISIRSHIIGEHRSSIHTALNNPHFYLQCDCCDVPETSIRPCMPDISIAYKLHLECGKMINLYDWLQAFLSIVDPVEVDDESKRLVKPELQARFTQAVQELEFLGFIKSSKRKADHVTRTTWGG